MHRYITEKGEEGHTSAESGGGTWRSGRACQGSPHHHTWSKLFEDQPFSFSSNSSISLI